MNKTIFFLILLPNLLFGQKVSKDTTSLETTLELALNNAVALKIYASNLKEQKLSYKLFQETLKPKLFADATFPNITRSIQSRPLPDGRDVFVNSSNMYNSLGLNMNYQLKNGVNLYAFSGLSRLDILKTNQLPHSKNYFFTPISIGLNHTFFQFNEIAWQETQNKLLFEELTMKQLDIREEILSIALQKYSTAFMAQLVLHLYKQKEKELNEWLKIKKRLFEIGQITKIEILRLELEIEKNNRNLETVKLEWEQSKMDLCDFIGLNSSKLNELKPPKINERTIDLNEALEYSLNNRHLIAVRNNERKNIEADLERTRKNNGLKIDFNVAFGFNKNGVDLSELYQNFLDQQTLSIRFNMPLNNKQEKLLREEIIMEQLHRLQLNFNQENIDIARIVTVDVNIFNLSLAELNSLKKTLAITEDIYQLSQQQYIVGNKNITELNIARREREEAILEYYRLILESKSIYYKIRRTCFYDFENNQPLLKN